MFNNNNNYNNMWQQQKIAMILQSQYQTQLLQQQQQQQQQQLQQQQRCLRNNAGMDAVVNLDDSDNSSVDDDQDSNDKRTLFIANLDEQVTEELLYELFLQAGPVESVRIPKDNAGKQRSFGFVEYLQQCSVPYALELFDGLKLYRRAVTIRPKLHNVGNNSGKQRNSHMGMSPNMGNGMYTNPFNLIPQSANSPKVHNFNEETSRYGRERNILREREREREREKDFDRRYNHGRDRHRRQEQSGSSRRQDQRIYLHKRL